MATYIFSDFRFWGQSSLPRVHDFRVNIYASTMRCLSTLGLVASLTAVSAAAKTEDLGVVIGIDLGTTYRCVCRPEPCSCGPYRLAPPAKILSAIGARYCPVLTAASFLVVQLRRRDAQGQGRDPY